MIDKLRKMHPNNHQAVLDMVISHQGLPHKMELVKRILSTLVLPAPVPYRSLLRRFAALSSKATADVALRAQQLLVSFTDFVPLDVVVLMISCYCTLQQWPCMFMPCRQQPLWLVLTQSAVPLLSAGSQPAGRPACRGGARTVRPGHVQ